MKCPQCKEHELHEVYFGKESEEIELEYVRCLPCNQTFLKLRLLITIANLPNHGE